jgi:DNA-binding transcriptional MerR regulator
MLSIGEFSNICKVSTKTLRYYAEIGLILPDEINPENGYRYYSIEQLETMLFINRLKSYNFSLEEIKTILEAEEAQDEKLYFALTRKKKEIEKQVQEFEKTLDQLNNDILNLKQGRTIIWKASMFNL